MTDSAMRSRGGVDLAGYFDRIGYTGEPAPMLATLAALMAGRNRCIPFENIYPLLNRLVFDLSLVGLAVGQYRADVRRSRRESRNTHSSNDLGESS